LELDDPVIELAKNLVSLIAIDELELGIGKLGKIVKLYFNIVDTQFMGLIQDSGLKLVKEKITAPLQVQPHLRRIRPLQVIQAQLQRLAVKLFGLKPVWLPSQLVVLVIINFQLTGQLQDHLWIYNGQDVLLLLCLYLHVGQMGLGGFARVEDLQLGQAQVVLHDCSDWKVEELEIVDVHEGKGEGYDLMVFGF
jgi:hypothetical protein